MTLIEKLSALKLIPVIAVNKAEDILPLAKTLTDNGLPAIEITFRSEAALDAIKLLRQHDKNILIGAGTVITAQQVVDAKDAGVDFIVSPGINPKIVRLCQELDIAIIPGVNNPMAIETALDLGVSLVKFFPAEASGGVKMLKALLAPYYQLRVMPTGGIDANNIKDYLSIPQVVACGGSWIATGKDIDANNWDKIGKLTLEASQLVQQIK